MTLMEYIRARSNTHGGVFCSFVLENGVRVGVRCVKRAVWEINGEIVTAARVKAAIEKSWEFKEMSNTLQHMIKVTA